jgi:transposase
MTKGRRSFTKEFKREAANLVINDGYSVSEASRSMGVGPTAMRRWVNQLEEEYGGITPKTAALTPQQQRIQELEKRVKELEQDKVILKKATALLMSDDIKRSR